MKYAVMIALLIAVAGGLMFVTNSRKDPGSITVADVPANEVIVPTETAQTSESEPIMAVEVEAGSFYYAPNTITAKKGQTIKVIMTSVSMMHDFVIDELGVKMPIVQNGNTGEIEFTPQVVGTYEYYCSVGEHRANGQVGKLIVTE